MKKVKRKTTLPHACHLSRYAAEQGIKNCLYIDDGRIEAESKELCAEHLQKRFQIWGQTGFVISIEKSDTIDSILQSKAYLGFILD